MRSIAASLAAATLNAAAASADEPGFDLIFRAGYGVGFADVAPIRLSGSPDGTTLSRVVPLSVEIGYRPSTRVLAAAYFQYAFAHLETNELLPNVCGLGSCSGSSYVVRIGAEAQYRFIPDGGIVPWAGLGAGYSSRSDRVDLQVGIQGVGNTTVLLATSTGGLDVNVQAGVDVRVRRSFAIGLYASFFTGVATVLDGGIRARFGP